MVRFEWGEVLTEEEFDRTVKSRWTHPPQFLAERSKSLLEDLRSGQVGLLKTIGVLVGPALRNVHKGLFPTGVRARRAAYTTTSTRFR